MSKGMMHWNGNGVVVLPRKVPMKLHIRSPPATNRNDAFVRCSAMWTDTAMHARPTSRLAPMGSKLIHCIQLPYRICSHKLSLKHVGPCLAHVMVLLLLAIMVVLPLSLLRRVFQRLRGSRKR